MFWPHNLYVQWMYTPALVGAWAAMIGGIRHATILCRTCATEFPEDGAVRATRATRRLMYAHHRMYALVGLFFLSVSAFWVTWLLIPIWIGLCLDQVAVLAHRRLAWWCPWCRDDHGGGLNAAAPIPTLQNLR